MSAEEQDLLTWVANGRERECEDQDFLTGVGGFGT